MAKNKTCLYLPERSCRIAVPGGRTASPAMDTAGGRGLLLCRSASLSGSLSRLRVRPSAAPDCSRTSLHLEKDTAKLAPTLFSGLCVYTEHETYCLHRAVSLPVSNWLHLSDTDSFFVFVDVVGNLIIFIIYFIACIK